MSVFEPAGSMMPLPELTDGFPDAYLNDSPTEVASFSAGLEETGDSLMAPPTPHALGGETDTGKRENRMLLSQSEPRLFTMSPDEAGTLDSGSSSTSASSIASLAAPSANRLARAQARHRGLNNSDSEGSDHGDVSGTLRPSPDMPALVSSPEMRTSQAQLSSPGIAAPSITGAKHAQSMPSFNATPSASSLQKAAGAALAQRRSLDLSASAQAGRGLPPLRQNEDTAALPTTTLLSRPNTDAPQVSANMQMQPLSYSLSQSPETPKQRSQQLPDTSPASDLPLNKLRLDSLYSPDNCMTPQRWNEAIASGIAPPSFMEQRGSNNGAGSVGVGSNVNPLQYMQMPASASPSSGGLQGMRMDMPFHTSSMLQLQQLGSPLNFVNPFASSYPSFIDPASTNTLSGMQPNPATPMVSSPVSAGPMGDDSGPRLTSPTRRGRTGGQRAPRKAQSTPSFDVRPRSEAPAVPSGSSPARQRTAQRGLRSAASNKRMATMYNNSASSAADANKQARGNRLRTHGSMAALRQASTMQPSKHASSSGPKRPMTLSFVNYGIGDAEALCSAVAPSGSYKVPLRGYDNRDGGSERSQDTQEHPPSDSTPRAMRRPPTSS